MSTNDIQATCRDCGAELKQSDKRCPKCGSTRKSYNVESVNILGLSSAVQVHQIREYEFNDYIFRLLRLNENFRNIRKETIIFNEPRLLADIVAEENVGDRWQDVLIECQSSTTFSRDRLASIIGKLIAYQRYSPTSKPILAFPGMLSEQAYQVVKDANIEIWDLYYLSKKFAAEIPQVQHPVLQSLLSGVKPSITKSPEEILIDNLNLYRPGRADWVSYQNLVGSILEQLFCPPLSNPIKEKPDAYAINRRDFIMPNYAEEGFWSFLRSRYLADNIVVDAKNYVGKVKKRDALQIVNYLKPYGAGLFGLIICRNGCDRSCTLTLREVWSIEKKLIIILTDYDLKQMLTAKSSGAKPEDIIRQKIEDFRLEL